MYLQTTKGTKVSFDKIKTLLQETDEVAGVFAFKDPTKKKNLKERIFTLTIPSQVFLIILLSISTLLVTNYALINIILLISLLSSLFTLLYILSAIIFNKSKFKDMIQWCENLYQIKTKFHLEVQPIAETYIRAIERKSFLAIWWLRIVIYVDITLITLGFAIIGQFLPESIYPKYSPPTPFYLPFNDQKSWIACISNTISQFIVAFHTGTFTIYLTGGVFCIIFHIIGYLDMIKAIVQKLKQTLIEKNLGNDNVVCIKKPICNISTIQNDVLAAITEESRIDNDMVFEEWIKIITDMICDVNSMIEKFKQFYKITFLLVEAASLGSLFICGLVVTILKQQYLFAFGNLVTPILFFFCFISEMILEKLEKINEALYDIPWYKLNNQEKKLLLLALKCNKIQTGFTAAGIHNLTMQRFGAILRIGYTNMLILKDVIQK